MKRAIYFVFFFWVCSFHSMYALQWNGVNQADDKTILLFHFDEAKGGGAASTGGETFSFIAKNATAAEKSEESANPGSQKRFGINASEITDSEPEWVPQSPNLNHGKGSAVSLSGKMGGLELLQPLNDESGLTISFWIKIQSSTVMGPVLCLTRPGGSIPFRIVASVVPDSQHKVFRLGSGFGDHAVFIDDKAGILDEDWHQIAIVFAPVSGGGSLIKYYHDGDFLEEKSSQDPPPGGKFVLTIGGQPWYGPGSPCEIDELLIQNSVISDFSKPYHH